MTGVGCLGFILYLLAAVDYGYCDSDNGNLVSHYGPASAENREQDKQSRQKISQLLSLLDVTSKRFSSKSFFPARGKKTVGGNPLKVRNGFEMMGFHGARGKRSLDSHDLAYLLYDNDYPLLRRLYPSAMQSFQPSYGQTKRLDSLSFFGARGKRPTASLESDENPLYSVLSGERTSEYKPTDSTKPGNKALAQLPKRQPPPGFYALRG